MRTKQRQQRSGWLCLLAGVMHLLAPLCPACPALNPKTKADARDRLLTVTAGVQPGTTNQEPGTALARSYTYDNAGKLKTVSEANVAAGGSTPNATLGVSYTYDAMGRVTAESSLGQVHRYEYDLAGNRVKATYSTGRIVETSYDGLNRPEAIVDGDRLTRYGYDKAGRAVILIAANGQTSSNTYDALGRLTDRVLYKSPAMDPAQRLAQFKWEHDLLGNVTQQEEIWPGEVTRTGELRRTTMGYDANNRLTSETIWTFYETWDEATTTTYTYDDANNRSSKTVTGGAEPGHWDYDYNAANQLTAWEHLDYPGGSVLRSASLTYDDAGNRTSQAVTQISGSYNPTYNPQPAASGLTTYTWDAQDRLSSVTLPATVAAGVSTPSRTFSYEYDYRTRRVGTVEQSLESSEQKRTAIVFSGGLSIAEYESTELVNSPPSALSSTPTVEYTRGPDMGGGVGGLLYTSRRDTNSPGLPVSSSPSLRYNLSNGRGDIVAQSDQYASLTWTASYEAYGKRTKETGENKDKQRGNSKDEDPTGLLNEGFRYRDIETGVWLSRDPAGFVDGPNLYAYVQQNPWTAFDPHGLTGSIGYGQWVNTLTPQSRQDVANHNGQMLAASVGVAASALSAGALAPALTSAGMGGTSAAVTTGAVSGFVGDVATQAAEVVTNGRQTWDKTRTAVATTLGGALGYVGQKIGEGVQAFKEGFNSVKPTAPAVPTASSQTTSAVNELMTKATALRDDLVDVIAVTGLRTPRGSVPPTAIGAVNTETGTVGAGVTLGGTNVGGQCSENFAAAAVGVSTPSKTSPVLFTPAVRPRTPEKIVPPCQTCLDNWGKKSLSGKADDPN